MVGTFADESHRGVAPGSRGRELCASAPPAFGLAVDEFDACDFSQGGLASAKDRGCGYYYCIDGRWQDPQEDSGCDKILIEPLPDSGGGTYCAPRCLADLDATTPGLVGRCSISAEQPQGATVTLPACAETADGWALPQGEAYCFAITTVDAAGAKEIDDGCLARGVNAGFEILGDVETLAGFEFWVSCPFELYPREPCPHAGEFLDGALCE
jgi:hypothetical protein